MTDPIQALENSERREIERFATSVAINLREAGKRQLPAMLTSLSHLGCSAAGVSLAEGGEDAVVWVRLPGIQSQPARKCWSTTGAVGLAFERPLHPAVARFIAGGQSAAA